jgi:uncharacterized damage-inducible protein DinB
MSQPWTDLFTINRQVLMERNLAGVTQSQADRAPAPSVNSITWILSHLVDNRRWLLGTALESRYRPTDPEPKGLERLMAAMDEAQAALGEAFDAVPDWNEGRSHPAVQTSMPLGQIVGTFFMEEAYHLGQIGTARKLLGLPGAMKASQAVQA